MCDACSVHAVSFSLTLSLDACLIPCIACEKLRLQASMVLNRGVNAREIFTHIHEWRERENKKNIGKTEPQNQAR